MSEPYIGEVKIWAGSYAPAGYAFCDGGTVPVSQYQSLSTIIGTTYGGDGRTTIGLPDLRDRAPLGAGVITGMVTRNLGSTGGNREVPLSDLEMQRHNHKLVTVSSPTDGGNPLNHAFGRLRSEEIYGDFQQLSPMSEETIQPAGGGQPHPNVQPFLALTFIIALEGEYPPRA